MSAILLIGSLSTVLVSPFLAAKVMRLRGGLAKGALVALVTLGLMQIIGMVATHLGPLGPVVGFLGMIAAWYQVVRVVHGTDTAGTIVFMFWHLFFLLLGLSLVALIISPEAFWVFGF